jgi:acetylornithine deacetylase/succinyl-diaminopimelate desuccinylase-like protein
MKTSHALCFVLALACFSSAHAADAAKVEYAERTTPFAPAATFTPSKKTPETNAALQERRVTPNVVPQTSTPAAERRAPTDINETREKNLITPDSRRPEFKTPERNAYDHRPSKYQPDTEHEKPKLVERYRTNVSADTLTHQGRFTAADPAANARINRFIFRRNVATPTGAPAVTPAGSAPVSTPK